MREILFRGKGTDNGEWVEGNFFRPNRILQRYGNGFFNNIEVTQETVGQYTGLTDNKGKKIFEGDIIKETSMHFSTEKIETNIYVVEWNEFNISYRLIWRFDNSKGTIYLTKSSTCEVIGNIHDNPELLEVKQ